MKITNVRAMVTKAVMVGLVAGAFVVAAPAKAGAQQFSFGVNVGAPYYEHRDYRDYEGRVRYEEYVRQQAFARQQAYAQHEAWEQHERREAWEQHERREAWEQRGFDDRRRFDRDDHRDWSDRR